MGRIKTKDTIILILIILLLSIGFGVFLQETPNYIPEKDILYIDNIYSNNQNQKINYMSRGIPTDSNTTDGAEMLIYFDKNNGSTKIIEVSYFGETFIQEYRYYFDDIDNFLLVERYQRWDRPYSIDGRIQTNDETSKYYFNNLKMISWINPKEKTINPQSNEFKQKEQEILQQLEAYLKAIEK